MLFKTWGTTCKLKAYVYCVKPQTEDHMDMVLVIWTIDSWKHLQTKIFMDVPSHDEPNYTLTGSRIKQQLSCTLVAIWAYSD